MKTLGTILLLVGVIGGAAAWYFARTEAAADTRFRTTEVARGDLLSIINATGTVEPEEVVDVGAQVVGRIKSFGIDPSDPEKKKTIDYGSVVHEGTELALIDDAVYRAQVKQAQASYLRAKADLVQFKAKYAQAEQEWKRAQYLRPKGAIADTDYDVAKANFEAAAANIEVGNAIVEQNAAALELAETNLNYTVIKSPVEGVIVTRRVNIGQTVVSSFNAPSLFLIAKDLRRIQVWASVNEADIGRIRIGMPVRFSVDAYPGQEFRGKVAQIRLNASMTQNVVTYTVVVETDNLDGRLLPYLTANLQFEVENHSDVLLVPNTALRWRPRTSQIAPAFRGEVSESQAEARGGKEPSTAAEDAGRAKTASQAKQQDNHGRLWVVADGFVRPIEVQVGASDGLMTCVEGDDLREKMPVVIGEEKKDANSEELTNPFTPKFFNRKPKQ